jgi:hypothetical protein
MEYDGDKKETIPKQDYLASTRFGMVSPTLQRDVLS